MWPPRNRSLGVEILNRAKGLLVPYFAWFVIIFAITQLAIPWPSAQFNAALFGALIGRGGLWYLYALFLAVVVVRCLSLLPGSKYVLAATAVVAAALNSGVFFELPNVLHLSNTLWIYPFVVLGFLLGPLREKVPAHRLSIFLVAGAAFVPLFYLRYPVHVQSLQPAQRIAIALFEAGIRGGFVLNVILPTACASAAIIALFALYAGRGGRAIDLQAWFGTRSLGIYAIHGPILILMTRAGVRNVFVLFAVALGLSAVMTAGLQRIPVLDLILLGQRTAVTSPEKEAPAMPGA